MENIVYDRNELKQAQIKVIKLIQKIIRTTRRPSDGHKIKKRTGNLLNNIRPIIIVDGNDLYIDIEAVIYYQFLDTGTRNIKPWNLTQQLVRSKEMNDILTELVGNAAANTLVDITSKIK
jgi:3-dehydroquinate dehydratase